MPEEITEPIEKVATATGKPWSPIFLAQRTFIYNLDAISEMSNLLIPILKSKDKERRKRIDQLIGPKEERKDGRIKFESYRHAKEFLEHSRKIRRADTMFRQGILISIVSKFDEFIVEILKVAFMSNPNWLKNPDKKITHKELFEISSLEDFKISLIEREIDSLMRDSHCNQIQFLDLKLKLGIEENFSKWNEFIEITERRNIFAHNGGIANNIYINNCKKFGIIPDAKAKEGTLLTATEEYINKALDNFIELSIRITQATTRRLFDKSYDEADTLLINENVDLLTSRRWQLAEDIFKFALTIPEKLLGTPESKLYFVINLCIALKFAGKEYKSILHAFKWNPFHPKYLFAVAVLDDNFEEASKLMCNQAVKEKIPEDAFKAWPLLQEFRKTTEFKVAFKDLFGKDFDEEIIKDTERELTKQNDEPSLDPKVTNEGGLELETKTE